MEKVSKEFLAGWNAARVAWQSSGSVSPYPPEVEAERTKQANEPPKKESAPKAAGKGG